MGNKPNLFRGYEHNYKPTYEIYPEVEWDTPKNRKRLKKLIKKHLISPILPPGEEKSEETPFECGICFNYFKFANVTSCCGKVVCTECLLQMNPTMGPAKCPFCLSENLQTSVVVKKLPAKPTKAQLELIRKRGIKSERDVEQSESIDSKEEEEAYKNTLEEYQRAREKSLRLLIQEAKENEESLKDLEERLEKMRLEKLEVATSGMVPHENTEAHPQREIDVAIGGTDLVRFIREQLRAGTSPDRIEELLIQRAVALSRNEF